jgi:uncharacterized protein YceK
MMRSVVLMLAVALSGCMTVQSKLAEESQIGHPYSGVTSDALAIRCLHQDSASEFAVKRSPFATSVFVVDTALSAVADTLFLPVDLMVSPKHERWTLATPCWEKLRR